MKWIIGQLVLAFALVMPAAVAAEQAGHGNAPVPAVYPAPKAVHSLLLDVAAAGKGFVAVGAHGVILTSQDGTDWNLVHSPVSVMLNRVIFADADHGWAVGHDGLILHTSDGGRHWKIQFRDASGRQTFYDIYAYNSEHAIAVGSGRASITKDSGKHWRSLTGPLFDLKWNFNAINRLADGCLMLVGERGILARSCDGGTNWEQLETPYIGSYYGVLPYGAHGAVVFGMRGHIYVTDNVAGLQAVDSNLWDPYSAHTVDDSAILSKMGWRLIVTPVDQSLFDGVIDAAGDAIFAGVGGSVIAGDLTTGRMRQVKQASSAPISGFLREGKYLLTVGRGGVGRVAIDSAASKSLEH